MIKGRGWQSFSLHCRAFGSALHSIGACPVTAAA